MVLRKSECPLLAQSGHRANLFFVVPGGTGTRFPRFPGVKRHSLSKCRKRKRTRALAAEVRLDRVMEAYDGDRAFYGPRRCDLRHNYERLCAYILGVGTCNNASDAL